MENAEGKCGGNAGRKKVKGPEREIFISQAEKLGFELWAAVGETQFE